MGEAAQAGGGASAALHLPGAPVDGSLLEGCVFFSAVTHRAISLGASAADPIPAPRRRGRPAGRRPAAKGFPEVQRLPTVSLGNLISAGLLEPGADVLSVSYKGSTHHASLTPGGTIEWNGRAYSSASAFSIAVKRLATPDKQGDDGWKSVVYHGRPLDELRQELRARLNTGASATRTPRTRRAKRATPESGEDERESGEDDAAAGPGSAAAAAHAGAGASSSSQVSASNSGADPPRWESQTNAPSEPGHGAGLPGGCPPPSGVGLPSGCPPPPGAAPAVGPLGAALVNGAPPAPPGGIAPPRREMAPGDALIAAQAALLRGVPPGVPPSQAASALAFATGRAGGGALPHVPAGPWPGQGLPPGFHSQT